MKKADMILKSSNIFTATATSTAATPIDGIVAISGSKLLFVGSGNINDYSDSHTQILDLGDRLICPGFVDTHCFFAGYAMGFVGADLSKASSPETVISILDKYYNNVHPPKANLGHGLDLQAFKPYNLQKLEKEYNSSPIPVVLFANGQETCWMNATAQQQYSFGPDTCYPEAYWKLLKEVLSDQEYIVPLFHSYMKLLNSRGITAVKEMGFDDYYGFADILAQMNDSQELTLRVSFMSQPVGAAADYDYGRRMTQDPRFANDFLRFSGYNRMTDGSISCLCADLKQPYTCQSDLYCAQPIDYAAIEEEVLAADALNFRYSLHAQGDAAISKAIDIFEKCKRQQKSGTSPNNTCKLQNRHAITDLEFSDPKDLERMGSLGITAEIYPQIMSLASRKDKLSMIEEKIGLERGSHYWNRRKMQDSNVVISCATDLPLLIPDIPESIYHACGALFPEGGEPFNSQNTLTRSELLTAWSKGGQYNLGQEQLLGTLEAGKYADIAVFDGNLFDAPVDQVRDTKVCLTIVNGKIVFDRR